MPHERIEGSDWHAKREHKETPDEPEEREVSDEIEKVAQEAAERFDYQQEIERIATEAAKEFDEWEARQKEIQDFVDEVVRGLEELEPKEAVDDRDSFEGELENDLDEVRDELHDEYINDMYHTLEGISTKDNEVDEGNDERGISETTESSESYEDAGTGMVYAMETKSESERTTQAEVEDENEVQEQPESSEPVDDGIEAPDDQFRNRISKIESSEFEQSENTTSNSIEDNEKKELQRPKSNEPSGETEFTTSDEETLVENQPELEHREPREFTVDDSSDSAEDIEEGEANWDSEAALETREVSDTPESDAEPIADEQENVIESTGDSDVESQRETESEEMIDDKQDAVESFQSEIEGFEEPEIDEKSEYEVIEAENLPEELVGFVKRVQDILDEEMDEDNGFEYIQNPLTGEMQRIQKILSDYETKEQERSRKLRNLFVKLTVEERNKFKALVRKQMENDDDLACDVERAWKVTVEKAELSRRNILLKALANERFYFEEDAFNQFLDRLQKKLGYNSRNQLIKQMNAQEYVVSKKVRSIRGDALDSCLDVLGESMETLEGKITRITGRNGQGGFENPRFPSKQKLSILMSRLGAIVNSDCYLRKDGCIFYYERYLERINRVEEILREFGDIHLHKKYREKHGRYTVVFPRSLGRAFIYWGFATGDKPIKNQRLSRFIREGGEEIARPYLEDLISEDGSFDRHSGFSWSRSVVLDAGRKNNRYRFKPKISQASIQFVKDHTDVGWEKRNIIGISMPRLKELMKSENTKISSQAQKLMDTIHENPSNLIMDEVELSRSLGINVETYPKDVTYSKTTGRFSVNWAAYAYRKKDILRWGLLAPPNDERKKKKLEDYFAEHSDDVEQTKSQLESEGFDLK